MPSLQAIGHRGRIIGEFFAFLWRQKLWWMIPMFALTMVVGLLLILGQSSALSPFIYTLF